jgi:mannonate dehydratase
MMFLFSTMSGESNTHFGYEMKGNLFGIGYIKGLMEAASKYKPC